MKNLLILALLVSSFGVTAYGVVKLKYDGTEYYAATYAIEVCAEKGYFKFKHAKEFRYKMFSNTSLARIQLNIDKSAYEGCKAMVKKYQQQRVRTPEQAAADKVAKNKATDAKRSAAVAKEKAAKAERKAKQDVITKRNLLSYNKQLVALEGRLADESKNLLADVESLKVLRDVARTDMNSTYVEKNYITLRFHVVQRLDSLTIEAKSTAGELFMIIDNGLFTSTGWSSQDMVKVKNRKVKMNNGFSRESAVFFLAPKAAAIYRAELEDSGYYAAKSRYDNLVSRISDHTQSERNTNSLTKRIAIVKTKIEKIEMLKKRSLK